MLIWLNGWTVVVAGGFWLCLFVLNLNFRVFEVFKKLSCQTSFLNDLWYTFDSGKAVQNRILWSYDFLAAIRRWKMLKVKAFIHKQWWILINSITYLQMVSLVLKLTVFCSQCQCFLQVAIPQYSSILAWESVAFRIYRKCTHMNINMLLETVLKR